MRDEWFAYEFFSSLLKANLRPPWMAEVPKTQEQFSADRHGWRKCRARSRQ
jgi:hypothetical protein